MAKAKHDDDDQDLVALADDDEVITPAGDDDDVITPGGDADTPPPPVDDEDDDEDEEEDVPPKTTMLTVVLCIFNVVGVLAFGFLLVMDLAARKRWAYQSFLADVVMQGLPLEDERNAAVSTHDLNPRPTLDPEWLKKAYQSRQGKSVSDPFRGVANPQLHTIRPDDLSDALIKDLFASHGAEPVRTLDEEIERLKGKIAGAIDQAAAAPDKSVKTEADKRLRVQQLLWPILQTTKEIDDIEFAARNAKAGDLDGLLEDARKRRLAVDALTLLDLHRPKDTKVSEAIRKATILTPGQAPAKDRFAISVTQLTDALSARLGKLLDKEDWAGKERDGLEKRRSVGFALLALGRIKGADGQPLYPPGRAEVALGTREFTQAADTLALVYGQLEQRILAAITRDRGGYLYTVEPHVTNPKEFAKQVVKLRERLKIAVPAGYEAALTKAMTDNQGLLKKPGDVLDAVKKVGPKIVGDPVAETGFDFGVLALVDPREQGFVGRHGETVARILELGNRVRDREARIVELQEQAKDAEKQFTDRVEHLSDSRVKLLKLREQSLKLAQELYRLQDELFRAQVELADADLRNQMMERHIRARELKGKAAP